MRVTGLVIFIMVIFSACSIFKGSGGEDAVESDCTERATVKSFSNVPGCQFLIVLEDGTKLQSMEGLSGYGPVSDGAVVKIDYEVQEGTRSLCRETDNVVSITCMDVMTFPEEECADKTTVFNRNWFRNAKSFSNATALKYHPTDSINYFRFEGDRPMFFNCYGKLECTRDNYDPGTRCYELLNTMKTARVIWAENK